MKPILFNTPMVQAILDGRKTVTRRVIDKDVSNQFDVDVDGTVCAYVDQETGDRHQPEDLCRYKTGDVLYVRETFFCEDCTPDCSGQTDKDECPFNRVGDKCYGYKTQYIDSTGVIKWRPSIHMPREAARIFLKVNGVRVERLQDISPEEIIKEGFGNYAGCFDSREPFINLWNSTIKPAEINQYGWDANPWVWVINFERITKKEASNE